MNFRYNWQTHRFVLLSLITVACLLAIRAELRPRQSVDQIKSVAKSSTAPKIAASAHQVSQPTASTSPVPATIKVTTPTPGPVPTPIVSPPAPVDILTGSICQIDYRQAPALASVAQNALQVCQQTFPEIEARLAPSPQPKPHHYIFTNIADGNPAETSGNTVSLNIAWFQANPTDMGAIVHESTHVVQSYTNAPGWITEGEADYMRYTLGYANSWSYFHCNPTERYTSGYGCAASLFHYTETHYDPSIVKQVDTAIRAGTYSDQLFYAQTGKTVSQLYAECRQTLCAGGLK